MSRVKFASQADPEILEAFRNLAKAEGRQFQVLLEHAMREYLEKQQSESPRKHVEAHLRASIQRNRQLGELLAK